MDSAKEKEVKITDVFLGSSMVVLGTMILWLVFAKGSNDESTKKVIKITKQVAVL